MQIRPVRAVLAVAVLAVLAGACGGDDHNADSAAGSAAPITTSTAAAMAAPTTTTSSSVTVTTLVEARSNPVTVIGPVRGGAGQANAAVQDLAAVGYGEDEFFIEGDAASYTLVGERTADGVWSVAEQGPAPYRTRIIVRRPLDAADFSGVVVVEWLNVTAGADGDPDWGYLHEELVREGHAWVGVSAQAIGVIGGEALLGDVDLGGGLVESDPERYGTLEHPGDAYAFDIYSQAGTALHSPDGPAPLGDLRPDTVIAVGESQSAFFLTTYINGVHPVARVYDGFLVHSRGGGAPDLEAPALDSAALTDAVRIRTDLDEPVLIFETETDLTALNYVLARQDDTESVRLWEVAGTAHADAYLLEEVYGLTGGTDLAGILNCAAPLNDGPQHEVLQAALHHLVDWAGEGTPPPEAPRLEIEAGDPPTIVRDEYGNALGGIRTPLVDVPVAALSGDPVEGGGAFCALFGSTTPFDTGTLARLYRSTDEYLTAFTAAADRAVDAGVLLPVDAEAMIAEAEAEAPDLG